MTLQGILLDVDGTLVLSNDAHAQAWVEAFAAFGYEVKFEQVRPLIGMGGDQIVKAVLEHGIQGTMGILSFSLAVRLQQIWFKPCFN